MWSSFVLLFFFFYFKFYKMREANINERIYLIQIRHLNQLINILFLLVSDKMYLNFSFLIFYSYMQNTFWCIVQCVWSCLKNINILKINEIINNFVKLMQLSRWQLFDGNWSIYWRDDISINRYSFLWIMWKLEYGNMRICSNVK